MNDNVSVLAGGLRSSSSGGAVSSVNGKTGAVVLDADDVGAEPEKLVVTFRGLSENNNEQCDKTYAEILAAYNAGRTLVFRYVDTSDVELTVVYGMSVAEISAMNTIVGFYGDIITTEDDGESKSVRRTAAIITEDTLIIQSDKTRVASPPASVTDLSSTSITLAFAADNTIYEYGELSSLTVSDYANPGEFSITFTSGATATVLTVPNTMIMPDGFAVEANTRYEIHVRDGYALCAGWAVST